MIRARFWLKVLFFILISNNVVPLLAMVFDNRYLPLLSKPLFRRPDSCCFFTIQPFFMTANNAWGEFGENNSLQEEFGLYEWHGKYDQKILDNAIISSGLSGSSLRSDLQLRSQIPWAMNGELHAIGFALYGYAQLAPLFAVGGSWVFLHANGAMEFLLDPVVFDASVMGDERELFIARDKMHRLLGVQPGLWHATGSGDLDLYMRFGGVTEYRWKLRRLDAGIKIGLILPFAAPISLYNPASITFGGNRHFGLYLSFEGEAELKEDLRAGLLLRVIKRFSRRHRARLPLLNEPDIFGSLVTCVDVDPGVTFVFSPHVAFDEVRDGLGFFIQYTLLFHTKDALEDLRKNPRIKANINAVRNRSSWVNEYVSIGIAYDVHASRQVSWWLPKVTFLWDIPVNPMMSKRANKTQGVSLLAKIDF